MRSPDCLVARGCRSPALGSSRSPEGDKRAGRAGGGDRGARWAFVLVPHDGSLAEGGRRCSHRVRREHELVQPAKERTAAE
jgi:hypothetical protein